MLLLLLLGCAADLPKLPVTSEHPDAVQDGYILGTRMGDAPSLFIMDREGYLLWDYPGQVGIQAPVVIPARDGKSLLYNRFAADRSVDIAEVQRLGLDGAVTQTLRTDSAHHTFVELPDGTVAYLAVDIRSTEEYGSVVGDRVLELHPDGTITQVFSVWDHFTIAVHDDWGSGYYPQGHDWTHANALFYDEQRETYLVSFRNINTFVEVARGTGQLIRKFGGHGSDYQIEGEGFMYQHGVHWTEQGTLLMTSSGETEDGLETWAVEYAVDPEAKRLEQIWAYGRGLGIHARALGEAHRLSNGDTLINWGTAGLVREVSPDGTVLWELQLQGDEFFGRTQFIEDISGLLEE